MIEYSPNLICVPWKLSQQKKKLQFGVLAKKSICTLAAAETSPTHYGSGGYMDLLLF